MGLIYTHSPAILEQFVGIKILDVLFLLSQQLENFVRIKLNAEWMIFLPYMKNKGGK